MTYDVIIIGKGPAGISAALYAKRGNLNALVIGKDESALNKAAEVDNYYGFEKTLSGPELLSRGEEQALRVEVEIKTEEVVGILYEDTLLVKTVEGEYKTKTIVIATGAKRNTPKVKGIKEYEGKGISYCAVCDGFFHKGKDVAVLGSGEYAISEALELASVANSVTILTNGGEEREVRNPKISFSSKTIREFRGNDTKVDKVEFEDDTDLDVSGIFIAEGTAATSDLARKIGVETEGNKIVVDANMATNIPGIFAAR